MEKKDFKVAVPLPLDEVGVEAQPPEPSESTAAPLIFRGKPIEWVEAPQKTTIIHKNAIGEDYIEERQSGVRHLIAYENKNLEREGFLKTVFPDYKKCPYKVNFKTDDIFRLGGN